MIKKSPIWLLTISTIIFFFWPELVEGNIVQKKINGIDSLIIPFLSSIIFSILCIKFNRKIVSGTNILVLWSLFIVFSILMTYTLNDKSLEYIVIINFSLYVSFVVTNSKYYSEEIITKSFYYFGIFYLVVSVFINQESSIGLSGALGDGYHRLGRTATYVFLVALVNLIHYKNRLFKILSLLIMSLGLYQAILSGHRMAIVVILLLTFYILRNNKKVILIFVFSIGIFSTYLISISPELQFLLKRFILLPETNGSTERIMFYKAAIHLIMENPIFGVGFGNFPIASGLINYRHPHNIFLEIWVEVGVFALFIFISMVKKASKSAILESTFIIFFSYFLHANVSGSITDNRILFFLMFVLILKPKNESFTIKLETSR